MNKRTRNIGILLGIAILTIIIIEVVRPTPINWSPSYTSFDKIPYGGYVVTEELKKLHKGENFKIINRNPFEFLLNSEDTVTSKNATYVFINNTVNIDKQSYLQLMDFAEKGNHVFISSHYFGNYFADSLKVETEISYTFLAEEVYPNFYSEHTQLEQPPALKRGVYKTTFKSFDTLQTTVLGYFKEEIKEVEDQEELTDTLSVVTNEVDAAAKTTNFIKVRKGKGYLFLHTVPEVFTNYYLLKNTNRYAATTMSFATTHPIIFWDDYFKTGRKVINSPMRYVLSQVPLKWAYYLLLFGLIIFVIIKGKRKQRIIQVIPPLENTTITFTQTIADLYFQQKEYTSIIEKKITYFLEKVRSTLYLPTEDLSTSFIKKLALKSNNSPDITRELVAFIKVLQKKEHCTEQDLITLQKKMNDFSI
ncbi:DUF4350 domain-containing protein [Aquimarina sp. ERC-38]|uniref:DUF4350 domain-containing protein n=1 Tax=Aquimarina sp. ERC-38 TaxID=2949996 RepID=UPI0022485BBB|nr:DUF4350 domain-containing protein [Aquimarina sp. ERC-38]UZO80343.1 DUF4350 domain-containing protein [Aquimarina sp. ERC-38]